MRHGFNGAAQEMQRHECAAIRSQDLQLRHNDALSNERNALGSSWELGGCLLLAFSARDYGNSNVRIPAYMTWREEHLAEGVRLINADCRQAIPQIWNTGIFDLVMDPPYGLGESNRKKHMSRGQLAAPRDYGDYDWDEEPANDETIELCRSISHWQIIFGGNYFTLPPSSCWLVWDKLNGDNDFADCELAWTNLPQAVRRIRWMWNGMLRAEAGAREHPTQKPHGVMKWCIQQIPPTSNTILDPFMGSGTTGVAAVKLGRRFVGIEIEPKYFEIAVRRISEALKQPDFFIERPKPVKQESLL
jgi:DNA modification methylase